MHQHPVPLELLAQIGDITVSFSLLEQATQTLVGSLIAEHSRVGDIITVELAFRNLRALVISLYKERHGEDADFVSLRDLMKRAATLEEKRNQISHSIWAAGDKPGTVTRIKKTAKEKHGIRFQLQNVSESDLATVANDLKTLAGEIQRFWIRLVMDGKAINNPLQKVWGSSNPGAV